MIRKISISELHRMLYFEKDKIDFEDEYECNGILTWKDAKVTVNGKPYIHMNFTDDRKVVPIQYFYRLEEFDPASLSTGVEYNFRGIIRKSAKGDLFFNIIDSPRRPGNTEGTIDTINTKDNGILHDKDIVIQDARNVQDIQPQEDMLFYPILAEELGPDNEVREELYYPIFADELEISTDETYENSEEDDDDPIIEFPVDDSDEYDFPEDNTDELELIYDKYDNIFQEDNADEDESPEEDADIEWITEDDFEMMEQVDDDRTNSAAEESEEKIEEISDRWTIHYSYSNDLPEEVKKIIEENRQKGEEKTEYTEDGRNRKEVKDRSNIVQNDGEYSRLYEALKESGGRIPLKKNDQGEKVPNMELIHRIENRIPPGEKILYAYYKFEMTMISEDKIKSKKKGIMSVKFKDLQYLLFIITETKVLGITDYNYQQICINKKDIVSINGLFSKSILKDSQIQILLKNNNWIIINHYIGRENDFTAYADMITDLLKN